MKNGTDERINTGMNGQYPWKKTEDIQIDLADMIRTLCRQWKRILVCALTAAVILGGYGWLKQTDEVDLSNSETAAGGIYVGRAKLTEEEERKVADAVQMNEEIRGLEMYLDNSVLMQLDPYHKARFVMLYSIDRAQRKELPKIIESYMNFVMNGSAADALRKPENGWKMDKSYLAELISAYQKTYSFPYQIAVGDSAESNMMSEAVFYVEITSKNTETAEEMALDMQGILKEYSSDVKKIAGRHRLTLVSTAENITADSGLQSLQHDKKTLLTSNKASLKAMTDAFSAEQMAAYKEASGESEDEQKEGEKTAQGEHSSDEKSGFNSKYMIIGLLAGILAYCCFFSCRYIFCDAIKSTDEIKRMYTFQVYGGILLKDEEKKRNKIMPGICRDSYGCTKEQVMNRIRLTCQRRGITRLYAAADFQLGISEKEYLESIADQFKGWGIDMAVAENVSADTVVWDKLSERRNVLMVCRTGTTTHRMINDTMNFYLENDIMVTGAVAFLQNE